MSENKASKPRTAPLSHEPEALGHGTTVTTNTEVVRQPFSGTKVETHSELQHLVTPEADYEEVEIRKGTVMRTYTGVQPGAQVVMTSPEEAEAAE